MALRLRRGHDNLRFRPTAARQMREKEGAFPIAAAATADSTESSAFGQAHGRAAATTNLSPDEGITTGPRDKLRRIADEGGEIAKIRPFSDAGANLKNLRNRDLS